MPKISKDRLLLSSRGVLVNTQDSNESNAILSDFAENALFMSLQLKQRGTFLHESKMCTSLLQLNVITTNKKNK